ncbi:MAG TPA: murein transglycosylase domain-containing protein, partial [Gammaproteobacteria bacterium]|nr:murein transglycosylase domain-containing protein [Gammaproteobacteria bacterium]
MRKHPFRSRRTLAALACLAALPLSSCSTYDLARVAMSPTPEAAVTSMARARAARYAANPERLADDIDRAERQFERLAALLRGEVEQTWGRDEVLTPGKRRYVKYTDNYKSRAIVHFDRGRVTVETVAQERPAERLRAAIVTTLLTPDDPRAVDLYSDRRVELRGRPYLYGLVRDQNGRIIDRPGRAEAYADYLVRRAVGTRTVSTSRGSRTARYVRFDLVSDYRSRQARRYEPLVRRYAERYRVSESLVFAVMKTESGFNPFAVSSAPAYGLMQLVPGTGGRDAFRHVKGYDHVPSKQYLFEPANNIELGAAYLGLIQRKYLAGIQDPVAREYCTISAYNGGAGNVLRTFSRDRRQAVRVINRLGPSRVYRKLRDDHPRQETRRYLVKVLEARR